MNIFVRELQAHRKSTVIWAASLIAVIVVFMSMYPAFTADVALSAQVLQQFPKALLDAMDLSLDDFFTIFGFFGYLMNFVILAGSIQAMNLGTGIIAKEISGKTADFLLTKPITRGRVVSAKLAAALVLLLATNVVFTIVAYATARALSKEPFSAGTFLLMASTLLLVQLFFLALGALFAVVLPKVKSPVAVSLPTVFTFYMIAMVGDVVSSEGVRYMTPFKFFDPQYIIAHGALEGTTLALLGGFVAVAVGLSFVIYNSKDVRAPA